MNNERLILLPANDKRVHKHIVLPNGLSCTLVSDITTEKSSACCSVAVGSLCDPDNGQGLAHFLEHMLFMGTAKYPVENAYSAFLNDHGGSSNAYTAEEQTVYYFDVQNDFFGEALDMFASFFTCPLFGESSVSNEINAVHSENTKNLQADSWRMFQLLKSLSRPDHPFSHFATGNLETLQAAPQKDGLNIRDLMLQFYERYYSSNIMKLAVYGKESIEELEEMVIQKFSEVPNKGISPAVFPSDPFRSQEVSKALQVVPVR
jgi:insulysin